MLSELPGGAQAAINFGLGIAAFAIGIVGYFKTKKPAGSEDDLTVLGAEDVTNNRVVRKVIDLLQKQTEALTALSASVTLYVEHVIEREDAAERDAEIERKAHARAEELRRQEREAEGRKPAGGRGARAAAEG